MFVTNSFERLISALWPPIYETTTLFGRKRHNAPSVGEVGHRPRPCGKGAATKISTNKPRGQNCRLRTVPFSFERRPNKKPRAFQRFARGFPGRVTQTKLVYAVS